MNLENDFETIILKKCGWTDEEREFNGTLIYTVKDSKNSSIIDVVCRRDDLGININWIDLVNKDKKTTLAYLRESNSIDLNRTDSEIKTKADVDAFLNNIESSVANTTGDFFPRSQINRIISQIRKLK